MFYHAYIVIPSRPVFEIDLVSTLCKNISTAAIFKAPKTVSPYVDNEYAWIVCYDEERFGGRDLDLELSNSGYQTYCCIDNYGGIPLQDDGINIPKLCGYIAFQDCEIPANKVAEFLTEFNPDLVEIFIQRNVHIPYSLYANETNLEYLASYLVSLVKYKSDIDPEIRKLIRDKFAGKDDDFLEFLSLLECFADSREIYPGFMTELIF